MVQHTGNSYQEPHYVLSKSPRWPAQFGTDAKFVSLMQSSADGQRLVSMDGFGVHTASTEYHHLDFRANRKTQESQSTESTGTHDRPTTNTFIHLPPTLIPRPGERCASSTSGSG